MQMRFLVTSQILLGIHRNDYLMPPPRTEPSETLQTLSETLKTPVKALKTSAVLFFLYEPPKLFEAITNHHPLRVLFVLTSFQSIPTSLTITLRCDELPPPDDG